MKSRRTINKALDQISGKVFRANKIFKNKKIAHKYRTAYNKGKFEPECLVCQQNLIISSSKNNLVHFEHEKNSDNCYLKSKNVSQETKEKLQNTYASKESPEHEFLKNKIGQLLKKTKGVNKNSVIIDKKFFKSEDDQPPRKPDVYCEFKGKELVFEIQLSNLSQSYIINRAEFYKSKGMYLIWILEEFDPKNHSQMELDIKYLTEHQNFFSLDKSRNDELRLICDYKKITDVTNKIEVYKTWKKEKISLSQINFDEENFQCYYYSFEIEKAKAKTEKIISDIKNRRRNKSIDYEPVHAKIDSLESEEIDIFNNELHLLKATKNGKPALNYYISQSTEAAFIQFLLESDLINIAVNKTDEKGITALQEIIHNDQIIGKSRLIKYLFKRGYNFGEDDEETIKTFVSEGNEAEKLITLCNLSSGSPPRIVSLIFKRKKLFYILESIKQNRIIGFNYDPENNPGHWIAFVNNAIDNYSSHWFYIESALKSYDLWDKLLDLDKNNTFHKKLDNFHAENYKPNKLNSNFGYLYPEAYQKLTA